MKKYYNSPVFGEAVISEDVLYSSTLDNIAEDEFATDGYDSESDEFIFD